MIYVHTSNFQWYSVAWNFVLEQYDCCKNISSAFMPNIVHSKWKYWFTKINYEICSGILLALIVMIVELCSHCSPSNEVQLHSRIDNKDLLKFKKILAEIQNDLLRKKRPSAILLSQLRESSRRIEDKQNNWQQPFYSFSVKF